MKTKVCLTIDTEHSVGGAWGDPTLRPVPSERRIFCRIGGRDHGIGWICDELAKRNLRATFFSEIFGMLVFGKDDTRRWVQYLLDRGQDVQLHTHLNFYYLARHLADPGSAGDRTDDLVSLEPRQRAERIEQACELFRSAAGRDPVAYRAGNWRANRELLAELANAGIKLDCSFNPAAKNGSFAGEHLQKNRLQRLDGIWELPLTVVRQRLPEPHLVERMRPFDLVSLSSWEIRKALDECHRTGASHLAAVIHSFSCVKTRDVQYLRMKPDRVVQGRLRFFLDYLAANRDRFEVVTCEELVRTLDDFDQPRGGEVPELGLVHPFARKVVQAVNSIYWV